MQLDLIVKNSDTDEKVPLHGSDKNGDANQDRRTNRPLLMKLAHIQMILEGTSDSLVSWEPLVTYLQYLGAQTVMFLAAMPLYLCLAAVQLLKSLFSTHMYLLISNNCSLSSALSNLHDRIILICDKVCGRIGEQF